MRFDFHLEGEAMMTVKRVVETGTCLLCNKEKEAAAVVLDGQGPGEILLCWADVRRMALMKMRMAAGIKPAGAGDLPPAVALRQNIAPAGNGSGK